MGHPAPLTEVAEVAVGVIRRGDRVLVTCRRQGPLAGLHEFPGGHREPDEDLETCLHRELWEETGYRVEVRGLLACRQVLRPRHRLWLWFFDCRPVGDPGEAPDPQEPRWVPTRELGRLSMPAPNARVVELLTQTPPAPPKEP